MSAFISLAPILEHTASENSLAGEPAAIDVVGVNRPRFAMASLLRHTAKLELAIAARLDGNAPRRLATA